MANGPYASVRYIDAKAGQQSQTAGGAVSKDRQHESALHHEGIMYGMLIACEQLFAWNVGSNHQPSHHDALRNRDNGDEAPIVSECSSGSQRIASVKGLASRYFQ